MRIALVAHGLASRDRTSPWTYNLAKALESRHDVWLFVRSGDVTRRDFEYWDEQDGRMRIRQVVNNTHSPWGRFDSFRVGPIDDRFAEFLDEVRPDVVHFDHLIMLSATLLAVARARGVPSTLTIYDHWWVCQRVHLVREDQSLCPGPRHSYDCVTCLEGRGAGGTRDWRLLLHDYRLNLMRTVLEYPETLVAPSCYTRDYMSATLRLRPDRIRVVPLGVPPLAGAIVKRPSERLRICFVGSVIPHKGIEVFARAAGRLTDLPIELHAYGVVLSPDYLSALRAIGPAVTYHGAYERNGLPQILGETDILVAPSLAPESFCFVVHEGAQARVPIVASRIGAIPEFIRDGENGLLVTPGSVEELAAALRRLIQDPALRARLSASPSPMRTADEYARDMEAVFQAARRAQPTS